MALTIAINVANTDTPYPNSGGIWTVIAPSVDYLVFSAGSDVVDDGLPIPTQSQLNQAGVVLTGVQQIVSKYYLADVSANELKQVHLMGNTTSRYVLAFSFDAATASEPVLELWDDANLNTVDGTTLGAGTPSNSWWRGITTTNSAGGANWTGSTLAGASDGHFLNLNDGAGALSGAAVLYCNLKIVVPASASTGTNATPKFAVKYASN
jgi:hypothetical protein